MTDTFDYGAAAGKKDEQQDVPVFTPDISTPDPKPVATSFDFEAAAGRRTKPPAVEDGKPLREITDPLGRPLINQPEPPQWSAFGTPLPGTKAADQGLEIHPLSRAVLQNFDLTDDISGNSAALRKIVRRVADRRDGRAPLPVEELTVEQLTKIVEQPRMQRALQLDSITRRRMAEDAEEAAILRGEIPFMLAAEGSVDTMVRMMRPPETRTPEAIAAQQNRGFLDSAANAIQRGIDRPRFGLLISFAQSKAARGRAARGNPLQTFSDAFKEGAFGAEGSIQRKVTTIPNPIDLLYGLGQGVGAIGDVYLSGGYNEATASRLEKEAYAELEDAFRSLKRAEATTPMSRPATRFMQGFQELPDDTVGALTGFLSLLIDDPVGFTAASSEVLAEQTPILAASAVVRKPLGGVAAISTNALGTYVSERFNVDAQRIALVKKRTGIDLNTAKGRADFLVNAEAQEVFSAYGRTRGAIIATGVGVGGAYFRGGTLVPMKSLTGRFAEQTLVSGVLDGAFEAAAGLATTGKIDVKEAIAEAAFGTNPVSVAIESTLSGRADYVRLNDSKKAKAWLEGSTEIKGDIAGIPVVKLDTAASVMGDKLESEGIETVYITASDLYTFDQDGEVAETLGLNPEDVARAAAEGGTVEVSASTFVRHILGKDGFDALLEHTMFDPTGMTPAEARQYDEAGIGDQIQQQIEERVRSNLAPGLDESSLTKLNTDMSTIQDQVAGQLEATGRYDANKSRLFGLLTAQRYATRAIRIAEETGQPVDASALFASDNLQIQEGQPAAQSSALEQGRIRSVWDTIRGKDSSSSVVTLRHGGPVLEGGKLDLEFTGRDNDPTSTSPRETTGIYFSTEGGDQATQFARGGRSYEARLPAESLSGVVDFMSRVSDLSPEMQQTLSDLASEAGIEVGRGESAGNLISRIRSELENGTERLVEAGISGHEKKSINEMVIWDQALLDSAELFDVTEGDPVQLRQEGASLFENPLPVTPTGKNNKILIKDIGQALTDDHTAQIGEKLFPEDNPDHFQQVLEMAIAEMDAQLERANSGVGWYDKDVNDAINTTAENLFPTLLTEPGHRDFFLILAGIFSNGTTPSQAWGMSAGAYEIFLEGGVVPVQRRNSDGTPVKMTSYKDKKTGEQVTKPAGWGVRNGANEQHLQFFKHLVETQGGLQEAADWMLTEHTPAEINEMMLASGAFKAGRYKTKKQLAGAPDRGVMVFGPKLGRYTMGLLGVEIDANDTTVDLWYTRTFRRWTGRLMDPPLGNEGVAAQPDPKNDEAERKSIFRLTEELSVRYGIGPGDAQAALWFFEKRLWATHGAQLDEGTNSQGAAKLLADRGIDVAERGDQPSAAVTEAAFEQQDPTQEVDFVGDVIFEVAPDPNNVELSARWNALPPAAQLAISDTVSKSVLPSVLEAAEAEGSVSPQIGSYLDDTNPSFSLRLTSGDPAAVANAVGFVLSQDSMVALSADAFEGSFEAGAVRIAVGDKSLQEIDAIYQTLRGIDGFPQIGGQSTTDGQMTLILEEGVDVEAFSDAVVEALPSEYTDAVLFDAVNVAFPEKKDYDYGSSENDPAGESGLARQRYRAVRDQAAQEVAAAIDQYERGGQQPDLEQQRGATAAPRGGFTPSDLITDQDGNSVNLIQIFEKADPTTFLHESGHFWLEQLKADALAVGGGLQQDFKTVTDWWASRPLELREEAVKRAKKAKDKDSVAALQQMTEAQVSAYARSGELRGEGPSRYLSVAMHEQFARGVENYFATGRAPSLSLAGVFSAFKVWVGSVYAKLAGAKLDVQFSAEVTAVIDRMLAADEEIALIEGQYNLAAMYTTAEQAGMTPTQFAAYQKKIAEAKDDRRARQLAKHIKELKRERTAWWNDERETLRGETEQEVAAEPAYRLLYALTNQGLADGSTLPEGEALDRMDRELLKGLLEAEGFSLDDIPRIDSKAVYEADGLSPGVVAQTFGYEDVDAMILDLVGRQPYAQAVDEAIDVKMEEEHGSIESSGETEALASAYSDKTAQVLAAELAALRTTEPAFKQAFVRAYARDRLLELPSAQIRPYRFLAAEKRHANMAGDALKRGDRVAAYQHQFQRLVNHYMATEALKAQRDIEKKTRYLKAFTKRGKKFPTIEADYVDNILRILAAVNFGQGAAGQQSRFNEIVALQAFIEEKQAADGSLLDVPAWLTDTSGSVANSTREISYLQFLQLHETIKRYEQQGRTANKIRRGDEELSLAEGKASLLSVLDGMNKSRVQRLRGKTASARGVSYTVASVIALADAQLLKVEALLEAIDGQVMGPWHQTIYEPFNQAAADKYRLQEEVSQVIGELISNLPKDVRRGFGKRVDVGALGTPGMTFTRGELIMMALNVGNESNLDKFIRGMGGDPETNVKGAGWNISEELIDAALDNLTEEEWSLVRGVWEHAEKLYPTVEGIYRREHGISPDRVEPRTVKTKFGEFKGGYFPMMYDRSIAGVAVDLQQKTALELMQAETGRASINSSMTKARTGYAAPVDLDISRLSIGLDNTIHFITHYGAVRNANKILGDRDIRAELETKVGIAYTEQLTKWVAALASNGNDSPPVDIFQRGIQQLYNNTTVGVLGFSYSTLGMQTLGLFNGEDRLLADSGYGPAGIAVLQKDMAEGVAAAFRPSHIEFVIQASGEMQGRRKSMDREVSQVLRNLTGKEGVVTAAQRFSMQAIAEVQFYTVDIPVWTAAYNRAQRGIVPSVNTGDTDAAIKYADRVVRMSQSAGGLKDLAAIQRHKGLIKGLTMFYSFFSALYFVLRSAGVEFTQNAKEKPIAATGRAATRLFVLLALQSVATGFIRGDLPDWDEEDEKKKSMLEYLAKESVSTALGTIPVVREIAAGWANGYGYSGGAGTIAFDAATKAMGGMEKFINELGEEETIKTDGDYEDLARRAAPYVLLLGALKGLPAVQANRTLDGLGAMYDEADNWYWSDLLRGYNAERAKRRED